MQDIIQFLEENKRKNLAVRSIPWDAKLRVRVCALQGFLSGAFTLDEFLKFMLPRVQRPRVLLDKYLAYVNGVFEEMLFHKDGGLMSLYGNPFFFCSGNYAEGLEFLEQVGLYDQYCAHKFLQPDSVIIDAGANIGVFAILTARLSPQGHVYAFEPVKEVADVLQKNVANYKNITAIAAGLGETKTERNILRIGSSAGGSMFEDNTPDLLNEETRARVRGSEKVPVMTIDDFVADNGITKVDFIKIDAEGYESNILIGATKTIQKWKPAIAMSAYHHADDKKKLPELLRSIYPEYVCELHKQGDEDFICHAV